MASVIGREYLREVYNKLLHYHVICLIMFITNIKTFNNGSLGSRIDEERSEMR